jgi:hypothetical protein
MTADNVESMARADGFASAHEMFEFFRQFYGSVFHAQLIWW